MFADAWDANEEDFFDDQYEETLKLLQNQGSQTRRDRPPPTRPTSDRPASDRPHIPKELWD